MVKNTAHHLLAFRLTEVAGVTRQRVLEFFTSLPDASYVVSREEDATRPHYHAWVYIKMTQGTLRPRIKKAFPECVGNSGYSLEKVRDDVAAKRYVVKGASKKDAPDIVCMHAFEWNETRVQEEHALWWNINARARGKGASRQHITDEVLDWIRAQEFPSIRDAGEEIAEKIGHEVVKVKRTLYMVYARGIFNAVMWELDGGHRRNFISELMSKF